LTTTSVLSSIQGVLEPTFVQSSPTQIGHVFAFYYPWYGVPSVSGSWVHWENSLPPIHNPNIIIDGRRDIASVHYPLIDVYDSNDETVIRTHIDMAKAALIDGFVASWWGIGSFEDRALSPLRRICEEQGFYFSIYYEDTASVTTTVSDLIYLLTNYVVSESWYRIDGRPVFFIYGRAREQLLPTNDWTMDGDPVFWRLFETIRDPPRDGIIVFHPYSGREGFVQSHEIQLEASESYWLKVGLANLQNDCDPVSDVGFRILIREDGGSWTILEDQIVNFNDGWVDWVFDVSSLAGQVIQLRVESYAGGVSQWCSEWACIDYLRIEDGAGSIVNPGSEFDSGWRTVVESLRASGYNPYFVMDFGGYEYQIEAFADYFFSFMDGIHTYNPIGMDFSFLEDTYTRASTAAKNQNKLFLATVVPGYDDTAVRIPGFIVERENGDYYRSMWTTAKVSNPDGFMITSFNEWHEGSEIEPSLEYSYQYIDITFQELGGFVPLIHPIWWWLVLGGFSVCAIILAIYFWKFKRP
jgi:hypothetical protein